MRRVPATALVTTLVVAFGSTAEAAETIHFESPHVHPLELTPDGSRLLAVNTSDHRLSVFDLTGGGDPVLVAEIPVGLEPITVRARTNDEVWVVNHLSDTVSIVDLTTVHVTHTILAGDEPTDVVFAGLPERAFVVLSQEDRLRIYDPTDLTQPPIDIDLEASDPRSLALSPDGTTLYVCALDSQNRTTILPREEVVAGGGPPLPSPPMDDALPDAPDVGLIVRHDGSGWKDETGGSWDAFVPYTLLDFDVLAISTSTFAVTGTFSGVGTALFNVAVSPSSGLVYVTNLESRNEVRFEPNLNGNFVRNQLTVIDPGSGVATAQHLNPHIDYADPQGTPAERTLSLALPLDVTVSTDGTDVYVAAFGSGQVGVLDADGTVVGRIPVGDGPSGLALDEVRNRLHVVNRLNATLTTVDLGTEATTDVALGYDPTPDVIRAGRSLFYDAAASSGHGDATCASCHIFGGADNIAWDLGDPEGEFVENGANGFHPMKGPMLTQALKGLPGTERFHWRGDRVTFGDFNGAFVSLLGRSEELSPADIQTLEDFVFAMRYPPNPFQNLDGSLPDPPSGPNPTRGFDDYMTGNLVGNIECVDCHALPTGALDVIIPAGPLQDTQDFIIPQLRNMYEKTRFDRDATTNVRGYGYTKDGAVDDLIEFLRFPAFQFDDDAHRADMAAFMLAFNFETPAALGAQWTSDGTAALDRATTILAVADQGDVGAIVKGRDLAGDVRGWAYTGGGTWISDREAEGVLTNQDVLDLASPGRAITLTAVLPGSQTRLGVDRDEDGYRDRDEIDAGSDPADPNSTPVSVAVGSDPVGATGLVLGVPSPNPAFQGATAVSYEVRESGPVRLYVHDVQGRLVRVLTDAASHSTGRFTRTWDLRDSGGRRVSGGLYFVQLVTASVRGSQRVVVMD